MRFVSAAARGMRLVAIAVTGAVPPLARDLVGTSGAGAIVYGVWQIHQPSAWIVGGVMLVGVALRLAGASAGADGGS